MTTLFLCGDVMTARGIDQILPEPSEPTLFEYSIRDARDYVLLAERKNGPIPRPVGLDYPWGDALAELTAAGVDARVINLETAITRSDDAWPGKPIHYRMHPANAGCLTAARIDVGVLANNHVLDWGTNGLAETLVTLEECGIRSAGAGLDAKQAAQPAVVPVLDGRVLVFGFGTGSSGIDDDWQATRSRPGVALLGDLSDPTADEIGERVAACHRSGDVVVASIHWGSNWGYEVPEEHVRFAHALIDRGVDLVHGHSSHHPRPIEIYREHLILYGCGDFLSDYEGIRGYEDFRGDLALAYFPTLDPASGELQELHLTPFRVRRLRLERASPEDVAWLARRLTAIGRRFGIAVTSELPGELGLERLLGT